MPRIDETDQDIGTEPPFIKRNVVIKKGISPKKDYLFSDELGRGRFGTVVKCTEKSTGLKLAAKFVSIKRKDERENAEREVDIMKSLQHRRLLQLYDAYDYYNNADEMCIITELINGGELFERVIDDDFELTEKVCAIFMRQICQGVEYMHEQLIMHLDMKPENILCVTRTGNRIKLIDFGLARRYNPSKSLQVMLGTPDFASPEVLSYDTVTPAADMWSVGVVCYVLLSGLTPFMGNTDLETITNVTKAVYDFNDEAFDPISVDAKDFISKLLVKAPAKRLTPNQCLNHKWLAKTPAAKATTQLSKIKLKKYVVRRRWQKACNAIMALHRMGAKLQSCPSTLSSSISKLNINNNTTIASNRLPITSHTHTPTTKTTITTTTTTRSTSSRSTSTANKSSSMVSKSSQSHLVSKGTPSSPSPSPSSSSSLMSARFSIKQSNSNNNNNGKSTTIDTRSTMSSKSASASVSASASTSASKSATTTTRSSLLSSSSKTTTSNSIKVSSPSSSDKTNNVSKPLMSNTFAYSKR